MSVRSRLISVAICLSLMAALAPAVVDAQRRGDRRGDGRRGPDPRRPAVVLRGQVFIGGYFYDPVFGPYPWWPRPAYPYWYYPVYDHRAEVRVLATPRDASVYVDGFYAGIVDDFDGVFQGLPLPPGGHEIVLYLEGYRTVRYNLYLRPGSTIKLHDRMERLPAGVASEPPSVAPPVPPPPAGSYQAPRTPPRASLPPPPPQPPSTEAQAVGYGTLDLRVQPTNAEVTIDGARWVSSDAGHYVVQVIAGSHRVEAFLDGYPRFSTEVVSREGETTPLNLSLVALAPK